MQVREATLADVELIRALINRAFRVEDFFIDGDRTDDAEIFRMMDSGRFLLGEDEGRVVGVVFIKIAAERGYFGLLSIEPTLQRRGYGRALVEVAEEACRAAGCRALDMKIVDVRVELPAFYAALGYQVTGTSPFPSEAKNTRPCHFVHLSKALA